MSALRDREGRLQVIFDGHCGLCNGLTQWLRGRDRHERLRFVAAESEPGVALLARYGRNPEEAAHTILVVREGGPHPDCVVIRSEAVVAILGELTPPWRLAGWFLHYVPLPLRNAGYRIVARMRYRIWGRMDTCRMPAVGDPNRLL